MGLRVLNPSWKKKKIHKNHNVPKSYKYNRLCIRKPNATSNSIPRNQRKNTPLIVESIPFYAKTSASPLVDPQKGPQD